MSSIFETHVFRQHHPYLAIGLRCHLMVQNGCWDPACLYPRQKKSRHSWKNPVLFLSIEELPQESSPTVLLSMSPWQEKLGNIVFQVDMLAPRLEQVFCYHSKGDAGLGRQKPSEPQFLCVIVF